MATLKLPRNGVTIHFVYLKGHITAVCKVGMCNLFLFCQQTLMQKHLEELSSHGLLNNLQQLVRDLSYFKDCFSFYLHNQISSDFLESDIVDEDFIGFLCGYVIKF